MFNILNAIFTFTYFEKNCSIFNYKLKHDCTFKPFFQMYDLYSNNTLATAVFNKANADVMAVTENKSYNATTVIVATWVNVPAHGSVDEVF